MSMLYKRLSLDKDIEFDLVVSGAHLDPSRSGSVAEIERDGFSITHKVETNVFPESRSSRVKSAAKLQFECADILEKERPDAVVFSGDREDVLVYATVCAFLGIPSIHFFGGDHAKDGYVDNLVRHATSKLVSLHFVSTEEHKTRLLALGEPASRIYRLGSVALDKFIEEPFLSKPEVLNGLGVDLETPEKKLAVLIFHPFDSELECSAEYVRNVISVLCARDYHVFASMPNTDFGNQLVRDALSEVASLPSVTVYENLSRSIFVNLLRSADLLIGNSSAALLEAPSIPLAAINVGQRQRGRVAANNVVFCGGKAEEIDAAVSTVESERFASVLANVSNPYGDGRSVKRAHRLIKQLDLASFVAKAEDPLES